VIQNLNLPAAYNIDMNDAGDRGKLKGMYEKRFKIKRSEYRHLMLTYTDTDPKRAADVLNEHIRVTEETYRQYYNTIKGYAYNSIQDKINEMDSSIAAMTDTLGSLRDQYRIYDIVSPTRASVGSSLGNVSSGYGVEQVQNIASIKDQLVIDRAKYVSLLNEFSTGTKGDELKFIQVTNMATAPNDPEGLGLVLTVLGCALLGFFFATLYILLMTYYRILISVQR
ncbi:MAG: hypothetical protein K0R82_2319, partial [Flavipsychrobacter sp.]|jgi:uncharacterized protein involved in exopolysaccharide biosynthesis|nr:hypothetical protein [Flavipsychrobacter sp.]